MPGFELRRQLSSNQWGNWWPALGMPRHLVPWASRARGAETPTREEEARDGACERRQKVGERGAWVRIVNSHVGAPLRVYSNLGRWRNGGLHKCDWLAVVGWLVLAGF